MEIAKGPLKREMLLYQEERTRRGFPLTGRAALWLIYQRCKLERGQAMCVDLSTIVQLEFKGDLEGYLDAWDRTLMSLAKMPDDDMLVALLETQLRKCRALGPAFVVYDGAKDGSDERCAKFLYDAARREIVRKQREVTKEGLIQTSHKAAPANATAKPKAQPKKPPCTTLLCR